MATLFAPKTFTRFATTPRTKANDEDPSWSPNGRYVIFVSDRSGTKELLMVDSEGRHEVQITPGGAYSNPEWGPRLSGK